MAKTHLKDESADRSYFMIAPRLAWALARNPYDYTLWCVIKDIAGETGECFLDREELAALAMMSAGQVTASLKHLMRAGLIAGVKRKDAGHLHACWHLTIPDLWDRNIIWSKKNLKLAARLAWKRSQREIQKGMVFEVAPDDWSGGDQSKPGNGSHPDQLKPDEGGDWSHSDLDWSPGVVKEEPQRRTTKKQEEPPGGEPPPALETPTKAAEPKAKKKATRPRNALFDSIADLCVVDPAVTGNGQKINKIATALKESGYTADDVEILRKWWWADPWRAKRNEPPSLWVLSEKIKVACQANRGANDNSYQRSTQSNLPTDADRTRDARLRAERERSTPTGR